MDHLYAIYANISSADLQEKDAVFRTPYDVNQPIESLFDQVENCVDYSAAGNTPYSLKQVIGIAFQLVYQTVLFVDDCKVWKRLNPQQKTLTEFKTFFATSHNEWRESQSTTSGAVFHSANHVQDQAVKQLYQQETVDVIANLATVTSRNRATVANLMATNSTLTSALTACQTWLVEALKDVAKLTTVIADLRKNPGAKLFNTGNWHYCWTHGYFSAHSSRDCKKPKPVHDKGATKADTKGVSTRNKPN